MKFTKLAPWQQAHWQSLIRYIDSGRIPQALLICGTQGIGKTELVYLFAASLLCTQRKQQAISCGICHSCRLLNAKTHPDYFEISPEANKTVITVEQIRALIANTYLKPQFESYRVILISPADAMTLSAANAFLKCLEEPTERTVFILLTAQMKKIPATITSRCQKIQMVFPDKAVLFDWLKAQGIDQNRDALVNLLKSSAITIGQLADPSIFKQRNECFDEWLGIASGNMQPAILSEKWKRLPENQLLNWLISWISDLIKCGSKPGTNQLCNLDFKDSLVSLSKKLELKRLYLLYSHLLKAKQLLGAQINFQMMIEDILVQWLEINRRN